MRIRTKNLSLVCLILLMVSPAFADQQGSEYTTFFGFTLNEVTLSYIQEKLGNSPMTETGDAAEYEASICYLAPCGYTIRFLSGELGGSSHQFMGYSVQKTVPETDRQCTLLNSPAARDFKPEIGKLKIGMTREDFMKRFGANTKLTKDQALVSFETQRQMTKEEIENTKKFWPDVSKRPYFDVVISVVGLFKEDRMIKFTVWKTETN